MKKLIILTGVVLIGAVALGTHMRSSTGQKTGQEIDHSYENAKVKLKNNLTTGPAEKLGKKLDQAGKKMHEAIQSIK